LAVQRLTGTSSFMMPSCHLHFNLCSSGGGHFKEANQMMVQAVEDTGLTVDMYSEIAQSATQDTALAERINSME